MTSVIDQYQMMRANHIIFGYRGTLTNELITGILQLIESKLKEMKIPFKKKKAIINILIECLQNILYHSDTDSKENPPGIHCIFLIGQHNDEFFIQIGNYIQQQQVAPLRSKLEYVNTLGTEEIHNLYMEVLDKGQISAKGGAGLGILRVLKDSGRSVDYEFIDVDAGRSFFSMDIKISG